MTTRTGRGHARRAAFTLIEMLVVIAIIAILVALTAAAVMRGLLKGPEVQTRTEIGNMDTDLSTVRTNFGLKYLPSRLRLRGDSNYNAAANHPTASAAAQQAIQTEYNQTKIFLQNAFGRHITDATVQIDWSGTGTLKQDLLLEGEQVLVFLLGGQPQYGANNAVGMVGFPAAVNGGASDKRGPFFEFQAGRLRPFIAPDPLDPSQPSLPFPVYIDPWKFGVFAGGQGMPYAFFSSYVTEGSGLYDQLTSTYNPPGDCPSLGLVPYVDPTNKWLNASSWQILSSGRDGKFGPGGTFNPSSGLPSTSPGADDQANFSPHLLGAPAN